MLLLLAPGPSFRGYLTFHSCQTNTDIYFVVCGEAYMFGIIFFDSLRSFISSHSHPFINLTTGLLALECNR